uniref:Outer membrane receptor proteins, mostly Fe transport n=1 Tax=Candidatus Kentrum sp. FW TaxID=2126338 RepID=A0A450TWN9_9GAMM|nr:MAG: Outer membrane receptor proteins, mostly Fe transport [Candidatus Kentron sp. FW]
MKRKNTTFRNSLHLALLGPALTLGAPGIAVADNVSTDTQQDESIPAGEPGDPIELDPIVAIGRMPPSTTVLGREVDTPSNRRLQDVLNGMPNILGNSGIGDDLPTMRGIEGDAGMEASQTGWTGAQPRVNTLVDGVARPFKFGSSISSQSGVWDVESVEVARGPQTTTTGRSSLSGAVHVSTRNPVHEFEAAVRAGGFTERGTREGAAMVNLPLVEDQVAFRFAAEVSDGETYVKFTNDALSDEFNENSYKHYRVKLLLTPDALPDTELLLSIENTRAHRPSPPSLVDPYAKDLVRNLESAWTGFAETDQKVYSAKLLQGLGEKADLEIRVSHLDNYLDYDPTSYLQANPSNPQWFDVETKTTSAEALLHFEELGFVDKGLVGVAYEYQNDYIVRYDYTLTDDGEKDNYAVFGEIEAGLLGGWTAIVGGRFERDDRRRDNRAKKTDTFQKQEWSGNGFSPKLGIRYDGADNYVAGYTYSEGWRPGGVDFHMQGGQTTTFDEERLKNHEIWVRANPLGRLSLNGSLFYYVFNDMQLRWDNLNKDPVCGWSATATCLTGNIPEAKGYGMELDGQFAINDAWRLSGGLGLLDTEVTDAGSEVPVYQGHELSQSPSVTWNTGIGWVSSGFDAEISVRHVGSFRKSYHVPNDDADDYTLVDFTAGYETKFRGTELRIDAWVENLMDKRYILPMAYSSKGGGKGIPGRPRTFGIAVTAEF